MKVKKSHDVDHDGHIGWRVRDVPHEDVVSDFEEIDAPIEEEEGGEDETEY